MNRDQFDALYAIWKAREEQPLSQRALQKKLGDISLGKVNRLIQELREAGWTDADNRITDDGVAALEPYRVKNAVIMAAGMSTRLAPLSYEKPKALMNVKGELLIEREIRQLQAAGITDITLVIGYMKEKMLYLADKFQVNIVVNPDYYRFNNPSSLILVTDKLDNTYICSSDNYFPENVFEPYVYEAYYATVYANGPTEEYCVSCNRKGYITGVTIGGEASWYMLGHVYFSRAFSQTFAEILKREYDLPETRAQLWENLYMRHLKELPMVARHYRQDEIKEFDSLDELRAFDDHYAVNSDSQIFRNIMRVLGCEESEIRDIHPIKEGLTNTSFRFTCRGQQYVYRHPGAGTQAYINRESEACSMAIARELGLDHTFIAMDPKAGWKLSHYIENARTLDYHDRKQVDEALRIIRTLHRSGRTSPFRFDIWEEINQFLRQLREKGRNEFEDMEQMRADIEELHRLVDADHVPPCLCHSDCYDPNFLIDAQGRMSLIDWEYSGMADPGCDLGTFIACSDYSMEEADDILRRYLKHEPAREELRHYIAYVAVLSFYWFLWAIYQESVGKNVGEYLYLWYRYAKSYTRRALDMYR